MPEGLGGPNNLALAENKVGVRVQKGNGESLHGESVKELNGGEKKQKGGGTSVR